MCRHVIILIVALLAAPAANVAPARAAWPPGPEAGFTADVYPSVTSAVRGLAPQLEVLVREASQGRPVTFYVAADTDVAVRAELTDALRRSFGDAEIFDAVPDRKLAGGEILVRALVRRDATYTIPAVGETHGGSVVIGVRGAAGERECLARFVEKPWLTDLERFQAGGGGRWVIGQADAPAPTRDAAAKAAVVRAAAEIVPLLAAQVGSGTGAVDGELLARRVSVALAGGRFIADRFACRFERPYGSVYHEAILVDASPQNIQALAAEASAVRRQTVRSTLGTAGSLAGLVAAIVVIYVLTNWLTKGYFAGRLRMAAVVALVAGSVLVLVLAGLFTRSAIRMDAPLPVVVN